MAIERTIFQNSQLWLAAIKLPIYSVAVVPISVGTATAYFNTHLFDAQIFFTFLGAAISIIAWLNLTNDVFDSETGIDIHKAHSVVNLTGNKFLVLAIANLCLSCGFIGIFALTWWQQDLTVLALVISCCLLGYAYQGPPFRWGYLGLGEIICFFTFGPGAVTAAYYAQTQTFSTSTIATATIVGISTSIILFCSHFHQVEDDLAAGKLSPIVRLGTNTGAIVLAGFTASIYMLATSAVILGYLPWLTLLIFASLPWAARLVTYVYRYHDCPDRVNRSKFIAVNLYLVSSFLLTIGLVFSTYI